MTHQREHLLALKIALTSVMVDDQEKALRFYTDVLGFEKKHDFPVGEYRWITVVSPAGPVGIELALEPIGFDFARTFQQALFTASIPATAFAVDDIHAEYERLAKLGVVFQSEPTQAGPVSIAVFNDTCGNLIQIFQV
jgi:catechol 2,3-dioxygenase-like lactoylglutathione lyase family enzyme